MATSRSIRPFGTISCAVAAADQNASRADGAAAARKALVKFRLPAAFITQIPIAFRPPFRGRGRKSPDPGRYYTIGDSGVKAGPVKKAKTEKARRFRRAFFRLREAADQ